MLHTASAPSAPAAPPPLLAPHGKHPVGHLLRHWRQHRRLSQLDLACDADISTKHLSFLETGRAQPSRDMLLHLAEQLEVPLRERNTLLVSAGFAPVFAERALDDPALQQARQAVDAILAGHSPNPALALDRHWNLVTANATAMHLMAGLDASLLTPPVNVLRASLHPLGLAPRIANYAQWRQHLLARLRRQVEVSGDAVLANLLAELSALPQPANAVAYTGSGNEVAVPFQLVTPQGTLSFISTTMIFGTAVDITLSELVLESFFPADAFTTAALRQIG